MAGRFPAGDPSIRFEQNVLRRSHPFAQLHGVAEFFERHFNGRNSDDGIECIDITEMRDADDFAFPLILSAGQSHPKIIAQAFDDFTAVDSFR